MALVVFTGGVRSGKSSAAEALARRCARDGREVTVVVFGLRSEDDPEFAARIDRHRENRPAGWRTIEAGAADGWHTRLKAGGVTVIDCVGTLLGLVMRDAYEASAEGVILQDADPERLPHGFEDRVRAGFDEALDAVVALEGDVVVVTNEVGDSLIPTHATGRLFQELLGRANQRLVAAADAAYLCVAGRCLDMMTASLTPAWPED